MYSQDMTRRELITVEEFTALSARLSYQLGVETCDRRMLMKEIMMFVRFEGDLGSVLESIEFL